MKLPETKGKRQHPVKILSYTTKSFWLILIPLARDLFASRYTLSSWLYGSWLSILTVAAIFSFALLRWLTVTYSIEDDCIISSSGFFGILESKISYTRLSCVSARQGPILRLFRASTVYLATAGNDKAVKLTMSKQGTERLFEHILSGGIPSTRYRFVPKNSQLVVFSLLFSSSLSGIIILITALTQAKRVLGDDIRSLLTSSVNRLSEQAQKLLSGIPPVLTAIIAIVVVLKALSFAANLFRHLNFSTTRLGDKLFVESGFISKRMHILSRENIVFCDIHQSIIMKLAGLCSIRIFCSGYGRKNRELSVLIPITSKERIKSSVKLLLPQMKSVKKQLSPAKSSFMSFVLFPAAASLLIAVAVILLRGRFRAVMWLFLIPSYAVAKLFVVRILSVFTSGIGQTSSLFRLDYSKGFHFHTVIVPASKISAVTVRQSPLQKISGKCTLYVTLCSPTNRRHKLCGMNMYDALAILRRGFVNSDRI